MSIQVLFGHIKFMVSLLGISMQFYGNGVINLYIYDLVTIVELPVQRVYARFSLNLGSRKKGT